MDLPVRTQQPLPRLPLLNGISPAHLDSLLDPKYVDFLLCPQCCHIHFEEFPARSRCSLTSCLEEEFVRGLIEGNGSLKSSYPTVHLESQTVEANSACRLSGEPSILSKHTISQELPRMPCSLSRQEIRVDACRHPPLFSSSILTRL